MSRERKLNVLQAAPVIDVNDAVSNDVLEIDRFLRSTGYNAKIFTFSSAPELDRFRLPIESIENHVTENSVILYHYPLHSGISDILKPLRCRKILIYHNVTPPEFFKNLDESLYNVCLDGVEKLPTLKHHYDLAIGDSEFNRLALVRAGFPRTDVLPIILNMGRFGEGNLKLLQRLTTGGTCNILFVGRVSPNKKHEDIIKAFYYYQKYINANARLYLVGNEQVGPYVSFLKQFIRRLGIDSKVIFTGSVSSEDLVAYYMGASVFLCMSEHEGFCVPLLEAMHFGVPIIAFNSCGVPYTLGNAGIQFDQKNFVEIAEMINLLITDGQLRQQVVDIQRERLSEFSPEYVGSKLVDILEQVSGGH